VQVVVGGSSAPAAANTGARQRNIDNGAGSNANSDINAMMKNPFSSEKGFFYR
jgi:hypothetical protein